MEVAKTPTKTKAVKSPKSKKAVDPPHVAPKKKSGSESVKKVPTVPGGKVVKKKGTTPKKARGKGQGVVANGGKGKKGGKAAAALDDDASNGCNDIDNEVNKVPFKPIGEWIINPQTNDKYRQNGLIGEGVSCSVYVVNGTFRKTERNMACKIIRRRLPALIEDGIMVQEIVNHSLNDKHPNIVKYFTHFHDETYFYVLMELCMNRTLQQFIMSRQCTITEYELRFFCAQIISGVKYLHSKNLVNRDLKPGNLLLGENFQVKLCDFGTSITTHNNSSGLIKGRLGTPNFIAPEVLSGDIKAYIGAPADVWSFGCIMYNIAYAIPPFEEKSRKGDVAVRTIFNNILAGALKLPRPERRHITSDLASIIRICLNPNPDDRPNMNFLSIDPYFTDRFIPKELKKDPYFVVPDFSNEITEFERTKALERANKKPSIFFTLDSPIR